MNENKFELWIFQSSNLFVCKYLSFFGVNISSIFIPNNSAILNASGRLGSYLSVSMALTVCRETLSGSALRQTSVSKNGRPHRIRASYPPHIQTLPRKILLFGSTAKRCDRFPTGSDCSTGCLRSIPACPRANRSTRH